MDTAYTIYYNCICTCNILVCTVPYRYILLLLDRWTVEELKKVIEMLRRRDREFDSKELDHDLHRRLKKAVQDG